MLTLVSEVCGQGLLVGSVPGPQAPGQPQVMVADTGPAATAPSPSLRLLPRSKRRAIIALARTPENSRTPVLPLSAPALSPPQ